MPSAPAREAAAANASMTGDPVVRAARGKDRVKDRVMAGKVKPARALQDRARAKGSDGARARASNDMAKGAPRVKVGARARVRTALRPRVARNRPGKLDRPASSNPRNVAVAALVPVVKVAQAATVGPVIAVRMPDRANRLVRRLGPTPAERTAQPGPAAAAVATGAMAAAVVAPVASARAGHVRSGRIASRDRAVKAAGAVVNAATVVIGAIAVIDQTGAMPARQSRAAR